MNTKALPMPPKPVGEPLGVKAAGTWPESPPLKIISSSRIATTVTSAITKAMLNFNDVWTEYQPRIPTSTTTPTIRTHQGMTMPKSVCSALLTKPPNRLMFSGLCRT